MPVRVLELLRRNYSSPTGKQPPVLKDLPAGITKNMHPSSLQGGHLSLFVGAPGTGKTIAASMIGDASGKDVYRIDLSTVISKYIGETEKNVERIFNEAEHKNWILFFDEAAALFGKRTEVRDAHDRYANQELAYLLQKIENYKGLVIIAVKKKTNIDEAFTRRLQSIIHFPLKKTQ